jgi:acetate kinase
MGFSPLSGLLMATRPGDLDAGLMIWLLRERGFSIDQVETMLYSESGLKGVSGISSEMRVLLESGDPKAREAIDLFVHSVVSEIGRLVAVLGGLDALVFTAGIGEKAPAVRAAICERCQWLGLRLDESANRDNLAQISAKDSGIKVLVVPTDEEKTVARHAARLVLKQTDGGEELPT